MGLTYSEGQLVFIDTAPFIYHFQEHPEFCAPVGRLFDAVYSRNMRVVTSMITYIELLTRPEREGKHALAARYRQLLTGSEHLSIYPLNVLVADSAVMFRARYGLKTPDAIQLATAHVCGADLVVTNDRDWSRVSELTIVQVPEL